MVNFSVELKKHHFKYNYKYVNKNIFINKNIICQIS